MSETTKLALPLLQPAQAQKHVTVNEALARLDGLVTMTLLSRSVTVPPGAAVDGDSYAVPPAAVNAWAGHDGQLAIRSNGGWVYGLPQPGWRAFIVDEGVQAIHDGAGWRAGALTLGQGGGALRARTVEVDHAITPGPASATGLVIPGHAMVIGVTARVLTTITGTLTTWQLGSDGAPDRFGSGLGLAAGSWVRGLLSQPTSYYTPTALELTATGGDFAAGSVRLAIHLLEIDLPDP